MFRFLTQLTSVHYMYHADENWQSLEVAYDLVYGKRSPLPGSSVDIVLSWEWNPIYAIRSHLYPFWLALPSFLLRAVSCDYNFLVVNSMYFMHCVLWVLGDWYLFRICEIIANKHVAIIATVYALTSETIIRYCSHTAANGVEGSFAIVALYYYLTLKPGQT